MRNNIVVKGQAVYARRDEVAEHPFGYMKRNLEAGYFLLRGLDGVRAEMSILSSCFNVARMITLIGAKEFLSEFLLKYSISTHSFSSKDDENNEKPRPR